MDKTYEELIKAFPKEAYSEDKSRNMGGKGITLTSIKSQWVIERMNEVFGVGEWDLRGNFKETDKGVIFIGNLYVKDELYVSDVAGACKWRDNLSDVYKSARTDCFSKACSIIGIGNSVFKGNIDPHTFEDKTEKKEKIPSKLSAGKVGKEEQELIQKIRQAFRDGTSGESDEQKKVIFNDSCKRYIGRTLENTPDALNELKKEELKKLLKGVTTGEIA